MKLEIGATLPREHTIAWFRQELLHRLSGRHAALFFVLLLGLIGYNLAPADLLPGQYTAALNINLPNQTLTADFPFELAETTGSPTLLTTQQNSYQILFEGADKIAYRLGQQLTIRLQLLDNSGRVVPLSLDKTAATLTGPDYLQALSPTQLDDGWLIFTMRLPYKAKITLGLLFLVAGLWLTELVPLAAASLLIPIVIVFTGVTDEGSILQPFAHPIILLFLAGFLMAEGMRRTGVDRLIALNILRRASLKPATLMLTMMGLTAFLSMWMSNTASVAVILPIALAVIDRIPAETGQTGFRRALILGVAYSATIGGIGSAIGTPANILAMTFLNDFTGTNLAFIDWLAYGLPMVLIMVPIIWLYLILAFRVQTGQLGDAFGRDVYTRELQSLGRMNRGQRTLLLVFAAVIVLWLTEHWHGIPTTIIALGGAFVLFFSQTIMEEDLKRINWNALLTFGGGLAIGTILVTSGVSDWIALMMAYSTGFFTTGDIFKRGILLDVIGLLLLSFGVIWIWELLGVVTLP
jgi:anion transporter